MAEKEKLKDKEKEQFEKEFEAGRKMMEGDEELKELCTRVYNHLYLIPEELRDPMTKIGIRYLEEMKKLHPEIMNKVIDELAKAEKLEMVIDVIGVGVIQLMVGLKHEASHRPTAKAER